MKRFQTKKNAHLLLNEQTVFLITHPGMLILTDVILCCRSSCFHCDQWCV